MPVDINNFALSGTMIQNSGIGGIVTDGLVLHLDAGYKHSYPMGGTTWYDLSGNGNNGTLTNGPTFGTGNGGSIVFDGSNDYVNIPYDISLNTPNGATYEFWIKWGGTAGEILNRGTSDRGTTPDNPRIYIYADGGVYADWNFSSGTTSTLSRYLDSTTIKLTSNVWQQLSITFTPGSIIAAYKNNENMGGNQINGNLPSPLYNNSTPIEIGGVTWVPRYTSSSISIVRLYNKVLSSEEIQQNYNATKIRFGL